MVDERYVTTLNLGDISGIILYLNDHEKANLTQLMKAVVPSQNRLRNTMQALSDDGLVNIEQIVSPKREIVYTLTVNGKTLAKEYEVLLEIYYKIKKQKEEKN